jgi:hypothetical protein
MRAGADIHRYPPPIWIGTVAAVTPSVPAASVTFSARRAKHFAYSETACDVQPLAQKYSTFRNSEYVLYVPPSRAQMRARRDRHERRARDAMDAVMPQDVRQGSVRSSRVVLIPRRWDQADRDQSIGDGG